MYTCENCGTIVTPGFARVFGNNRNEVNGCPGCLTSDELERG